MKINRIFLAMMAAGLLVGCSNDDSPVNGGANGEVKTSYVSVDVKGTAATRAAADGGYAEGSVDEQKVTSAHFFFFKADGSPYVVNAESMEAGDVAGTNYLIRTGLNDTGNSLDNVETITNAVLTIKNNDGEIPASMTAVLNWNYADAVSLSLNELRAKLVAEANMSGANGFIMSNSVYRKGSAAMYSTPITAANIASSEADATAAGVAVEVYVERVAAKASLNLSTGLSNKFDTGVANPADPTTNVHAVINGWALNTTMSHSNLIKTIDPALANNFISALIPWNDEAGYRSYWGESVALGTYGSTTVTLAKSFSWNSLDNALGATEYCAENTTTVVGNNTKALVAVNFVDESDAPVQIAKIYGHNFTIDGLRNYIANAVKENFYYEEAGVKKTFEPSHIDFATVGTSGKDSYTVEYNLTSAAAALTWHKTTDGGATFTAVTSADVEAALDAIENAMIWNGKGYYIVDIEHLADGVNGVVRNHSYVISVDGVSGLGTPVYDGNLVVDEPTVTEDSESFIAAKINVATWKVSNQNVVLQ